MSTKLPFYLPSLPCYTFLSPLPKNLKYIKVHNGGFKSSKENLFQIGPSMAFQKKTI